MQTLSGEIGPFICSGSHVIQKDCHPSAISAFVEAVFRCGPPAIGIKPCVIKYIAKSHNLWHRALLVMEQTAADSGFLNRSRLHSLSAAAPTNSFGDFESTTTAQQVI
jgi:transformation/transcription domain-associated protein